jgi:hypothetical protein
MKRSHVPLDQAAHLPLRVAALHHALARSRCACARSPSRLLGAEADHRQQVLDLAEHALLDHLADLLVGGPGGVARPGPPGAQRELDHLVAEVLRVGDAGRLLDLGQLLVEQLAVQHLAGVGILEVLVLDPGVGVGDVAVEQVLPVIE